MPEAWCSCGKKMGYIEGKGNCLPASATTLIESLQDHFDEEIGRVKDIVGKRKKAILGAKSIRPTTFDGSHGYNPERVKIRNQQNARISRLMEREKFKGKVYELLYRNHRVDISFEKPNGRRYNRKQISLTEALKRTEKFKKQVTSG